MHITYYFIIVFSTQYQHKRNIMFFYYRLNKADILPTGSSKNNNLLLFSSRCTYSNMYVLILLRTIMITITITITTITFITIITTTTTVPYRHYYYSLSFFDFIYQINLISNQLDHQKIMIHYCSPVDVHIPICMC